MVEYSKYAHSIKNPHIIHYVNRSKDRYLCIGACSITKSKMTRETKEVTCKNCIRKLLKWGILKLSKGGDLK
jgi:hypothetical protein